MQIGQQYSMREWTWICRSWTVSVQWVQVAECSGCRFCNVRDVFVPGHLASEGETNNFERQTLRKGATAKHEVRVWADGRTEGEFAVLVERVGTKGSEILMGGYDQGFTLASVEGHEPA